LSSGLGELYCRFGALPALAPVLVATKAAIVGVMLGTAVRMAPAATKSLFLACVGIAMVGASVYLEVPPLITLLGAGAISALGTRSAHATGALPFLLIKRAAAGGVAAGATATAAASFGGIFLYFLFVGSTIYGGAFVLVSYLHSGLVDRLHWLTDRQLMDAITVGQLTPGPVFCTASFAGYLLRGPGGAALATLGIFAPCLVLVPLMKRFVGWTRSHALAGAFLDGVGVGAIALMLSIGIKLAPQAAGSWALGILAAMAGLATLIRLNAGFVVLAAGLAGWMLHLT
jgi:chromate transporter